MRTQSGSDERVYEGLTPATSPMAFFAGLRWITGAPLVSVIEPYRAELFERFFAVDDTDRVRIDLGLFGRAKKNWKTTDADLAALYALLGAVAGSGGRQVYIVTNDAGQAADNLTLLKKIIQANSLLQPWLHVKKNVIERRDGEGFIEILPGQDAIGAHGKTFRLLVVDEFHGHRNWDLLEALAPDPTRHDTQTWITTYATMFHRPGVPLHDLIVQARTRPEPRVLFSWYAADFTTDAKLAAATPEDRANPSRASWRNPEYLAQQRRRLPSHKYRRLHLNLPGLPDGAALQAESVLDSIARGVVVRLPEPGLEYVAFVDMSGGSNDDAVLAVAHRDVENRAVLDRVADQGQHPPFDPNKAVDRFVGILRDYGIARVTGDRYAGLTFRAQFEAQGIRYQVCALTTSQVYESLEPRLNGHQVVLPDVARLEQQLLGLIWRGGKITHPNGEHDDHATACAGVVQLIFGRSQISREVLQRCFRAGTGQRAISFHSGVAGMRV